MVVSCRHYGHFASRMIEVKGSATILIVSDLDPPAKLFVIIRFQRRCWILTNNAGTAASYG
jgi:hypothetical protein